MRSLASAPRGTFLLAQESTQRRAPGFRPGTLLQGPRAGGAELAAPAAPLRHPAPSPGPRTLPQGAPCGRRRSKQTVSRRGRLSAAKRTIPHVVRNPDAIRCAHHILRPPAPASRARHARAKGRACSRCRNSLPPTNGTGLRIAVVLTYLPVVVAPSGEAFRGVQGAGCLSAAQRSEFSAAREKPRSEGNPGPRSGPGSRQSGVFLGYFFARAKKYLAVRSRESAWQAARRRHVNIG